MAPFYVGGQEFVGFNWIHQGLDKFMKDLDRVARAFDKSDDLIEEYGGTVHAVNKVQREFHGDLERLARQLVKYGGALDVLGEESEEFAEAEEALMELVNETTDAFLEQDKALEENSESLDELVDGYKTLDGGAERTTSGLRRTTQATRETETATRGAAGGFQFLGGAVSLAGSVLTGFVVGVVTALTRSLIELGKEGVKALAYLATAPLRGLRDLAELGFNALIGAAGATIDVLQNVASAALNMAANVAQALGGMIASAIDVGIRYETALAGVFKTTEGLIDDVGELTGLGEIFIRDLDQLALRVPVDLEKLLRIAELGGQFNITEGQLVSFAETIAAMATATTLSVDAAALAFGRIGTVFGISDTEFDNMGSAIVWLGNNMGVLEKDIVAVTERLAGAAQAAGFTVDETLGISAAFLRVGLKPQAAASSIQKVMLDIHSAVQLGNEDLETFAVLSGRTVDDFVAEWKTDPAVVFADFVHGLGIAGDDAILIMDELGLSDIRVRQAFLSMAKAPDILTESLVGSNEAMEENTALAREAAIRYGTTASQIQLVKNRMDLLGKTIFNKLAPAYQAALGFGRMFTEFAMKALLDVLKEVQPFLDTVTLQIQNLSTVFEEGGPRAFVDELMRMAGFDATTIEKVNAFIDRILGGLQNVGTWIADNWETAVDWISTAAEDVVNWFIDNWPTIEVEIQKLITWVRDYDWAELWKTITTTAEEVIKWFETNWPTIEQTVIDTYNAILDFLFGPKEPPGGGRFEAAGKEAETIGKRMGGFVDGLVAGFEDLQDSIIETARMVEEELIPAIHDIIANVAVLLGMDPEEALDPFAAGEFTMKKVGEIIEGYGKLYDAIFKVVEYVTRPDTIETLKYIATGIPPGALEPAEPDEPFEYFGGAFADFDLGSLTRFSPSERETIKTGWSGIWESIQSTMLIPLGEALTQYAVFTTGIETDTEKLKTNLVGQSLFPDMMAAIIEVFETGLAEINTLWTTFWTGVTTEAGFGVNTALDAMGVETGATGGLLGSIERSLPAFRDSGRRIARAVADGILEAAYMMVEALASNIDAMNVAVESDETIDKVLFDIGEKIVKKIAAAIIKSYRLIYEALEHALSLGGQLIHTAAAGAQNIASGQAGTPNVSTPVSFALPVPVTAPSYPQQRYGVQSEGVQVGPNIVRDQTDIAILEDVARRVIEEQFRP